MNKSSAADLEDRMAALVTSFANALPARVKALEDSFTLVAACGDGQLEALQSLQAVAHKLAGSAGTFGFPEISGEARSMEVICMEAIRTYPAGIDDHVKALRAALQRLIDDRS